MKMSEKLCRYCFEPLIQGDTERPKNYKIREYCNKAHAAAHFQEKKREKRR